MVYLMNPGDHVFFHIGYSTSDDKEYFTQVETSRSVSLPINPAFFVDDTSEHGCRFKVDSNQGKLSF